MYTSIKYFVKFDLIGGLRINVLSSSVVDRGFDPKWGETKNYKIGICCFFSNHATLRIKREKKLTDLPRNQYESDWDWSNMSTRALLYQGARDIKFN